MPRIVRIDPQHTANAISAVTQAQTATDTTFRAVPVATVADCLRSVVGASKVLHFVNDAVFPIWDSKIETFRQNNTKPTQKHMKQVPRYLDYVAEVHGIRQDPGFRTFFSQFVAALDARLVALNIVRYKISEVRAIEAAAFELAP